MTESSFLPAPGSFRLSAFLASADVCMSGKHNRFILQRSKGMTPPPPPPSLHMLALGKQALMGLSNQPVFLLCRGTAAHSVRVAEQCKAGIP